MATPPLPSVDRDRFDAYMQRAGADWKEMDARRVYEWKVSFGLWTALGALAGFFLNHDQTTSVPHPWLLSGLIIAVGLVYTFLWTPPLRERGIRNLQTAHFFWNTAERLLNLEEQSPSLQRSTVDRRPPETIYFHWASGSQVLITWLLAIIAVFAIRPQIPICLVILGLLLVVFACLGVECIYRRRLRPTT